jgi:hypothetical protein
LVKGASKEDFHFYFMSGNGGNHLGEGKIFIQTRRAVGRGGFIEQ